jgi:hypothetical protein
VFHDGSEDDLKTILANLNAQNGEALPYFVEFDRIFTYTSLTELFHLNIQ